MVKKRFTKSRKSKNETEIADVTGLILKPGYPRECEGNGENGKELCCDECDGFLSCFPEYNNRENNL